MWWATVESVEKSQKCKRRSNKTEDVDQIRGAADESLKSWSNLGKQLQSVYSSGLTEAELSLDPPASPGCSFLFLLSIWACSCFTRASSSACGGQTAEDGDLSFSQEHRQKGELIISLVKVVSLWCSKTAYQNLFFNGFGVKSELELIQRLSRRVLSGFCGSKSSEEIWGEAEDKYLPAQQLSQSQAAVITGTDVSHVPAESIWPLAGKTGAFCCQILKLIKETLIKKKVSVFLFYEEKKSSR